jgi:hypothetical protein
LIVKWKRLFMLQHHLPLHVVFIVLLYGEQQLLRGGCAPLRRDALSRVIGARIRGDSGVARRILFQHAVENEHIFLNSREKVSFFPREMLLRVDHMIVDKSQNIIVYCLSMLLHMLPDLGHNRLKSLIHLIR